MSLNTTTTLNTLSSTLNSTQIGGLQAGSGILYDSNSYSILYPNNSTMPLTSISPGSIYNTYADTNYKSYESTNTLCNLKYVIKFDTIKKELLENNIKGIKKNKFLFNCNYLNNRIQPYEYIMSLIEDKTKISVTVNISDILSIHYISLQFMEIENNLNFNSNCDFSVLKVKFKCENILYINHNLSEKEVRTDKLKKILKNNE